MEAWEGKLTFKGLQLLISSLGLELSFQDIQTHLDLSTHLKCNCKCKTDLKLGI